LRQGPFILITEAEDLLRDEHPGVVSPNGVSVRLIASLKAVIFDDSLQESARKDLESTCRNEGIPYFYTQLPADQM